jgi:hypothetical protein
MLCVTRWVSLLLGVIIRCVLIPTWYRQSTLHLFVGRRPDIVSLSLALRIVGMTCDSVWAAM